MRLWTRLYGRLQIITFRRHKILLTSIKLATYLSVLWFFTQWSLAFWMLYKKPIHDDNFIIKPCQFASDIVIFQSKSNYAERSPTLKNCGNLQLEEKKIILHSSVLFCLIKYEIKVCKLLKPVYFLVLFLWHSKSRVCVLRTVFSSLQICNGMFLLQVHKVCAWDC